jgi:quercetin dioxygenase-like cupin family protein
MPPTDLRLYHAAIARQTGVSMELIRRQDIETLSNSAVRSRQLIFPENSRSRRITVTRVTLPPGIKNPPHRHATSEQVWVALSGCGTLLLDDAATATFSAGDVVRFEDNEYHGFENTGEVEFEYISITSPPLNFRGAYEAMWSNDAET